MSDIDVAQDEDSEVGAPTSEWSSHMVRGTWLSKNHEIFHYGLPSPLLDHLRRARNSVWQSNTPVNSLLLTLEVLRKSCSCLPYSCLFSIRLYDSFQTQELLETDLNVLRDLSSTFEGMMEAFGDEKQEDRYLLAAYSILCIKYSTASYLDGKFRLVGKGQVGM